MCGCLSPPPPPNVHPPRTTVPPTQGRGGLSPSEGPPPLGGRGMDTTPNQPLTGAYDVEFMAGQLLAVGRPRIWDTRCHA